MAVNRRLETLANTASIVNAGDYEPPGVRRDDILLGSQLNPDQNGKPRGYPPTSAGVLSGWRSIGRLLFSRAKSGYPIPGGNA